MVLLDQVGPNRIYPCFGPVPASPHPVLSPQTNWSSVKASACWRRIPRGCCCSCSLSPSSKPQISFPCDWMGPWRIQEASRPSAEILLLSCLTPLPNPSHILGRKRDPTPYKEPQCCMQSSTHSLSAHHWLSFCTLFQSCFYFQRLSFLFFGSV